MGLIYRISPLLVGVSSSFSVWFWRGYNVVGQNPEVFSGDAFNIFWKKKTSVVESHVDISSAIKSPFETLLQLTGRSASMEIPSGKLT